MEIDRAIADSSKDLVVVFAPMSEMRLVRNRAEAELVLTVSTRRVGSQAHGELALLLPLGKGVIASSTPVFQNDYWLSTVLEVGPTYRKEFVGTRRTNIWDSATRPCRSGGVGRNVRRDRTTATSR
jgi:hypothetical protein